MSHIFDFLLKQPGQGNMDSSNMDLETMGDIDDIPFNSMNSEFMSSDFFDNVMSMERNFVGMEGDLLGDPESSLTDGSFNDVLSHTETHSYGDALSVTDGLSHIDALSHSDGLLSPGAFSSDGDNKNDISSHLEEYGTTDNILMFANDDIKISYEPIKAGAKRDSTITAEELATNNNIYSIIKQEAPIITAEELSQLQSNSPTKVFVRHPNTKKIIVTNKQVTNHGPRIRKQVLRVQSLNGNGKSVLLPINCKNFKKVRIVNTGELKLENLKTSHVAQSILKKPPAAEMYALSSSESVDDDMEGEPTGNRYPPLSLTAEEKRLLMKEGIALPSHYPLTKNEEKDLKRIRRKIRNKISAQDSRKRKKEYVDKLEEKAKRTTEENEFLRRKIKMLHKQNSKLMEQMKRLQALLFNTSSSKATPTTCLMIVLFSTLLVCLPNLKVSDKTDVGEQQLVAARRALLFKQGPTEDEVNMDDFLVFNKDEESELENYEDDSADIENNTENGFAKLLGELSKKFEHPPDEKNCSQLGGKGGLFEFCDKYKEDIKGVVENMKEFFEKNNSFEKMEPPEKLFIEPDISDDEDAINVNGGRKRKLSDLADDRLVKKGKLDQPIMDDFVTTTVDAKLISTKTK